MPDLTDLPKMPSLWRERSISGKRSIIPENSTACSAVVPSGTLSRLITWFSGKAYATSISTSRSGASINFFRTFNECFHKAIGYHEKYRTHQLFEKQVRERVMQSKFYFAGVFRQRYETPVTVKVLERPVQQGHGNQF